MQSYYHPEISLLPQSDFIEHMKLNNAAKSQTEGNIKKFIDSIIHYFSVMLSVLDSKEIGL